MADSFAEGKAYVALSRATSLVGILRVHATKSDSLMYSEIAGCSRDHRFQSVEVSLPAPQYTKTWLIISLHRVKAFKIVLNWMKKQEELVKQEEMD